MYKGEVGLIKINGSAISAMKTPRQEIRSCHLGSRPVVGIRAIACAGPVLKKREHTPGLSVVGYAVPSGQKVRCASAVAIVDQGARAGVITNDEIGHCFGELGHQIGPRVTRRIEEARVI